MTDLHTDRRAEDGVDLRRGGGQYPDYRLGEPTGESRYGGYESGRDVNYYEADPNLRFVLEGYLDPDTLSWAEDRLEYLGERCGRVLVHRADQTDKQNHDFERYDKYGRDVSEVRCHPNWTANLNEVFDFGMVGWNHDEDLLRRYGRAPATLLTAFDYLAGQAEASLCCPLELSHGTIEVLERFADEELREKYLPRVVSTDPETRFQVAQVATEITGGSDIGSTRTVARRDDDRWLLSGEKWFASNVNADLIITLGRIDDAPGLKGLSLFAVPRRREDGSPNGVSIRRLKDKMGTIGVPTGELILSDAEAYLIGDPADGYRYMFEMLNHTRYYNAVGSLGLMRRSYLEASVYAARRHSFGKAIEGFPMVRENLVWMTVDLEATTAVIFETAAALERYKATDDAVDHLRFRTLAPMTKYRAGEQGRTFARLAIETLGGNGAVKDFGVERLYRDAQINAIWEGTSNIVALDTWRAITTKRGHEPVLERVEELIADVRTDAARRLAGYTIRAVEVLKKSISTLQDAGKMRQEQQARRLVDLFGDVLALGALTKEADRAASAGDYRKAVIGELFAMRLESPTTPFSAAAEGYAGVPEAYKPLFAEEGCSEDEYREVLRLLGRDADNDEEMGAAPGSVSEVGYPASAG